MDKKTKTRIGKIISVLLILFVLPLLCCALRTMDRINARADEEGFLPPYSKQSVYDIGEITCFELLGKDATQKAFLRSRTLIPKDPEQNPLVLIGKSQEYNRVLLRDYWKQEKKSGYQLFRH